MKRIVPLLLLVAALGCATAASPSQPGEPGHPVGSGSIGVLYPESVSLVTGTIYSTAHYVGSIDLIGDQFQIDNTGTAVCSAPVLECSNSVQLSVDLPTDDTKWVSVTMTTSPPAIASGANKFVVQYPAWPCGYYRWAFTCSSGASTLTLTHMNKGG